MAICSISSIILEPYVEINCLIDDNTINIINYEKITFGNVSSEIFINGKDQIIFDGFEGEKILGKFCSNDNLKCNKIIEKDYGINPLNLNNPKIYEYSICLITDEKYDLKNKNIDINFNDTIIGKCLTEDIYDRKNISQNKIL